jgi:hypothetical protein
MKIITKGKWKHFVMCSTCDAELLLDAGDVKLHVATQNVGDREFMYFECPCCECDEELPSKDIPPEVKKVVYEAAHKPTPRPQVTRS